jgi:hypothetical protein
MGALGRSLGAPQIMIEQSGKHHIFFWNGAGEPGNHSYYLSFNDCENSFIQFVFSSMYLDSYPSTHDISGLGIGDT